ILKLGGIESRWIRAVVDSLAGATDSLRFNSIQLQVATGATPARPVLEGLANSSPLVLDTAFFPLGREPRLFDAFYLGCTEVFSKRKAEVTLTIDVADGSLSAVSAFTAGPNQILAGVAGDGALHLIQFDPTTGTAQTMQGREALQPPVAGAGAAASVTLDKR